MTSPQDARNDFYIGYLPETSRPLASWLKRKVALLFLVFLAVPLALITSMGGFSSANFEFGVEKEFRGTLYERPYPSLVVDRPGLHGESEASGQSTYSLVAFGKHGANEAVSGLDGSRVELRGTLIYRDDQTMIELVDGSISKLDGVAAVQRPVVERGEQTLRGEIVDSKCFLGVMKPGNLKPHRACATRCISGGIPPVLLVRDAAGRATYYVLVAEDGSAVNRDVLDFVAEPISIRGRVVEQAERLFLYADPTTYRRLDELREVEIPRSAHL